jgi:protein-disulfide isomerase
MVGSNVVIAAEVAAVRINGQTLPLSEIDAPSQQTIIQLRKALVAQAARTIDLLVDRQLQASTRAAKSPSPEPVTDEAIRALRDKQAADFEGPFAPTETAGNPAVAQPAIRYYLEQKELEAAKTTAHRQLREGHAIKVLLPEGWELERALPPERPVALVDGDPITAAALEQAAALALYRLRMEIYLERQSNMEKAIENGLLVEEARRRHVSIEALLAETAADVAVNNEELKAFIEAERAAGLTGSSPERARPYLEFRKAHARRTALIERLRAAAHIEILVTEPATPSLPVIEADAPALGEPTGLRLVVYTNYRCDPCRTTHREIDRLLAANRHVRVIFRDFIPAYDPVAGEAARLSRCADRLGAFERMRSELLARDPPTFGEVWYQENAHPILAGKLGIDSAAFSQCLSSTETRKAVERDTAQARELGFEEAPSFVAQGIPLSGMQSAESLAGFLRQSVSSSPNGGIDTNGGRD